MLRGDICYTLAGGYSGSCGVRDYCPQTAGGDGDTRYCTPRLAAGDVCNNATNGCPTYMACTTNGAAETTNKTCQIARMYWIPAGQKANTSRSDCYHNMWDNSAKYVHISYHLYLSIPFCSLNPCFLFVAKPAWMPLSSKHSINHMMALPVPPTSTAAMALASAPTVASIPLPSAHGHFWIMMHWWRHVLRRWHWRRSIMMLRVKRYRRQHCPYMMLYVS